MFASMIENIRKWTTKQTLNFSGQKDTGALYCMFFFLSAGRCVYVCVCVCLCILTFQSFMNAIRVSNSLDPDQIRCLSGMICLQLSADDKCIPIVKRNTHTVFAEFIWRHIYTDGL